MSEGGGGGGGCQAIIWVLPHVSANAYGGGWPPHAFFSLFDCILVFPRERKKLDW